MDCVDENLAVCFLAGTLPAERAAEVDVHMDGCPDCLLRLTTLARLTGAELGSTWSVEARADSLTSTVDRGPREAWSIGPRRGESVGRYVVLDLVGVGAMGNVYSAADPVLGRNVALKLVRRHARVDDDVVREARLLAQVVHPNVVAVHDVGRYGEDLFIAMEYVAGQTLREWLASKPTPREILRVFALAGRGLAAAHAVGVVHRDFKPDNVLVGDDGRVAVTDFGLACAGAEGAEARIVGTPAYMAPEQSRGRRADERADQFSFCVALHEGLFGARPPTSRSGSAAGRSVPSHVRRALRRGLSESPEERHPSMAALLSALENGPWRRWRAPAIAATTATIALAIVLGRARTAQREVLACRAAESQLDGVWDAPRRQTIEAAFRGTAAPYAEDAWRRVEHAMNEYTRDWTAGQVDACEATQVRHEQPATVLEQRASCYRERLEELRAVADVLANADQNFVRSAGPIVHELSPLAPCGRGLPTVAPPAPAIAPAVARLRGDLTRSRALRDAGRLDEGRRVLDRAVAESSALGFLPLEAVALVDLGVLQSKMGDKPGADATLTRAARVADAARDDAARLRALSQRLFIAGVVQRRADAVAPLDADATALLLRIGPEEPRAEEMYRYNVGMAYLVLKDLDRAEKEIRRAAELVEQVYGSESYDAARTQGGLCRLASARGRHDEAVSYCLRAAKIFEQALGPHHPDYAIAEHNLGVMMLDNGGDEPEACRAIETGYTVGRAAVGPDQLPVIVAQSNFGECLSHRGEHARALELLEGALAARERAQGAGHVDVTHTMLRLGRAYVAAGQASRAVPLLERAVRIRSDANGAADERAMASFALASAITSAGGDRARARTLADSAARLFDEAEAKTPLSSRDAKERTDLARWRLEHP